MEPAQAKPVRRRRRWLIVAFVVLVSGVAWWNWPRGDARFVGTWAVSLEHYPAFHATTVLKSDGTGFWPPNSKSPAVHFPWSVSGNKFAHGYHARSQIWWLIHEMSNSLTGNAPFSRSQDTYEILSVGPDQIRLRCDRLRVTATGEKAIQILTRLPE